MSVTETQPIDRTLNEVLVILDLEFGVSGIDAHDDLFVSGLLDSLTLVELVLCLEDTFDVVLGDHDISMANFATGAAIAQLILSVGS